MVAAKVMPRQIKISGDLKLKSIDQLEARFEMSPDKRMRMGGRIHFDAEALPSPEEYDFTGEYLFTITCREK